MKPWLRRTMGLLPIVGGGAGLTVLASFLGGPQGTNALSLVIMAAFALLYVAGIVAGLWMLEGHRHAVALNLMFWVLQIPQLLSPVFAYYFWAPMNLGVWWNHTTSKVGLSYQVGSAFELSVLNSNNNVAVALNLFALACSVYLYLLYRHQYPRVVPASSR